MASLLLQADHSIVTRSIRWFSEISLADLTVVGGKNASLGELFRNAKSLGIRVPDGFATTAGAFREFMTTNGLSEEVKRLNSELRPDDIAQLQAFAVRLRNMILAAQFSEDFEQQIRAGYSELEGRYGKGIRVAVRSSATAEDLPSASFAGQQESFVNVSGEENVLAACKRCFASLFTDRAVHYRASRGFDHTKVALSVGVQQMVDSENGAAGVMFSLDTESGFRDVVLITAAYGLGEGIVQGMVKPDEYLVFKPVLGIAPNPIIRRRLGEKAERIILASSGATTGVLVPAADRDRFVLTNAEVVQLAQWCVAIENHYSRLHGQPTPMDLEWARDAGSGELFILQARPETVHSQERPALLQTYALQRKSRVLATGRSVGAGIGAGKAMVLLSPKQINLFEPGSVLVTTSTDPDWEPVMRRAAAIVTEEGGRTCHAAIVARELGIPAVVGAAAVTSLIGNGREVTVSCAEGEVGKVYDGIVPFEIHKSDVSTAEKLPVEIMITLANPDLAFQWSRIPNDGVGLARMEFIITDHIRVHPMAIANFDALEDEASRDEIAALTRNFSTPREFFVSSLAEGIATIAAAFSPKPVILRFSDFKTNEYSRLLGGGPFEPKEENPMLGWRGASRYYDEQYRRGFALECEAILRVRREMGLTNLHVMVPFCRTPEEGEKVLAEMANNGLRRGEQGLQVYVMCEIPSNVLLADEFAKIFDGFSIGSNDLTQLVLGVDRDSAKVAHLFDERNPAVKTMVAEVIKRAKQAGVKIGICGQAPSDYPEFAVFLVEQGIDSISLNPDSVLRTRNALLSRFVAKKAS